MSEKCANIFCINYSLEYLRDLMQGLDGLPTMNTHEEYLTLREKTVTDPPISASALNILSPFFRMLDTSKVKIVKTSKAALLTSEFWVWGEAFMKAADISRSFSMTCFTIDHKEYGFFMLNLIEKGEIITRHAFGSELSQYGFQKSTIDFGLFSRITGIDSSELEHAFAKNDKEKIVKNLTDIVGLNCTIAFDDLQDFLISETPLVLNKSCELYVIK